MLKDLKLAFCSAAITSASVPKPALSDTALSLQLPLPLVCLGRAIWRLFLRSEHDEGQFKLRDMRAARRRRKIIFNPLALLAASNLALSNRTSTGQEHRHA